MFNRRFKPKFPEKWKGGEFSDGCSKIFYSVHIQFLLDQADGSHLWPGINVPVFRLKSIMIMMNKFLEENKIGKGGYGPACKGTLSDESLSQQLDWGQMLLEIVRRLLYLHQDSRLKLIHRDFKSSNILLDEYMNPKISDFDLARLFQRNQTEEITFEVAGTFGYITPEYAFQGHLSLKYDVYSFDIILLEIISGKKIGPGEVEHGLGLIAYAWKLWREGNPINLMDKTLASSCNEDEFLRCIHTGHLCVQEDPKERPTMLKVFVLLDCQDLRHKQLAFPTKSYSVASTSQANNNEITIEEESPFIYYT
ncbi:hypothetical protein DITRI_Ditri12bG0011400 [Diplodiscus trichospermus]